MYQYSSHIPLPKFFTYQLPLSSYFRSCRPFLLIANVFDHPRRKNPYLYPLYVIYNLREKFSPGSGFEPGSPALRCGAITTKLPRRSPGPI